MFKMKSFTFLIIFILAIFLSSCARPVEPLAIQSNDYSRGFDETMPAALAGDCHAQYQIGYMYYNGLGVARDQNQGRDWIRLSAQQNCMCAVMALREITRLRYAQSRR